MIRTHGSKKNKGFTLVELLVVITLMAIMVTLTVSGILAWQDWSDFNRANEYAETIYVAAQNQLTEFSANGRLEEFKASMYGFDTVEDYNIALENAQDGLYLAGNITELYEDRYTKLIDPNGNAYIKDSLWPEAVTKIEGTENLYMDKIVSLRAEMGDYDLYLSDPEALKEQDLSAYWVFEILDDYVYDKSILSGGKYNKSAICLEVTVSNGQVFSALFSEKHEGFKYEFEEDVTGDIVDITDRTERARKADKIGYYGVDSLYAATTSKKSKLEMERVALHNENYFYLTAETKNEYKNKIGSLDFTFDLNGSMNQNDKVLTLNISGSQLRSASGDTLAEMAQDALNKGTARGEVFTYDASGNQKSIGVYEFIAFVDKNSVIYVIFDAADLQAQTIGYKAELNDILAGNGNASGNNFNQTFSYFRFGVPINEVYASATAGGAKFKDSKMISNFGNGNPLKDQTAMNPVFANGFKDENNVNTYSVKNGRHFYNIRYVSDISYEDRTRRKDYGDKNADQITATVFSLDSGIDFGAFQQEGYLMNGYAVSKIYTIQGTRYDCDYPSYAKLGVKDHINGNLRIVSGIHITKDSNTLYGCNTNISTTSAEMVPTGLFNINYGEMKNFLLDDITVTGTNMVGSFAGVNIGEVSGLTTCTNENSFVRGNRDVGGIIGFEVPSKQNVVLDGLTNNISVTGTFAVGGIVGMARNEFSIILSGDYNANAQGPLFKELKNNYEVLNNLWYNSQNLNLLISNCNNYGKVIGVSNTSNPEDARFIGGIAGYCYNQYVNNPEKIKIQNCYSCPRYEEGWLLSVLSNPSQLNTYLVGDYVGGIVGYNHFGEIDACSSKAKSKNSGYLFGYKYVGGIVGFNIGPSSGVKGATIGQGTNSNNVVAYEYAGGIVGCNADVSNVDNKGNQISKKDPEKIAGILVPDTTKTYGVKVAQWRNEGIVIAVNQYAGGITGYNAGYIYGCTSVVSSQTAEKYFNTLYTGSYAGGITGYNNGVVSNADRDANGNLMNRGGRLQTVTYVKGHYYVGGVVGYNDVDAVVEDYEVAGGFVLGDTDSCYVGGYVGFNASMDLLMDTKEKTAKLIISNPNRVVGDYCVGGSIGANIINTKEYTDKNKPVGGEYNGAWDNVRDQNPGVIAKITFKENGGNENSPYRSGAQYHIQCFVEVQNNTDQQIVAWKVIPNHVEKITGYLQQGNVLYEMDKNEISSLQTYATKIPAHGSVRLNMCLIAEKEEDLIDFKNYCKANNQPVVFSTTSGNVPGRYEGDATSLGIISVLPTRKNENYNNEVSYRLDISKNDARALPQVRVEVDVNDINLIDKAGGWATFAEWNSVQTYGNTLVFIPKNDGGTLGYYNNNGTIHMWFDVKAGHKQEELEIKGARVSFNNVLYWAVGDGKPIGNPTPENPEDPEIQYVDIPTYYKTDNFLGVLKGKEFVGGFAGYNMIFEAEATDAFIANDVDSNRGGVYIVQRDIIKDFEAVSARGFNEESQLAERKNILDHVAEKYGDQLKSSIARLLVTGQDSSMTSTSLGHIEAELYVGGVLGYNDLNTNLCVKDVKNATPIFATESIENQSEQPGRETDYAGRGIIFRYSYAGGVIGRIGEKTTIDHCYNSSTGAVTAKGTYTGGLSEINDGKIINCEVFSFGNGVTDYLGGLCGLNKGTISDCSMDNTTVSGRNVVGAFAAENAGIIKNITLNNPRMLLTGVDVYGSKDSVCGIFAGMNLQGGEIHIAKDIQNVDIYAKGRYVGAIVGVNAGAILNEKDGIDYNNPETYLKLTGRVESYMSTGGFIGRNIDTDASHKIRGYRNDANVTVEEGNAGGIIGENDSVCVIEKCANFGPVTATNNGNAGGITAYNNGKISNCSNYVNITASRGLCGGIAAINGSEGQTEAVIEGCLVSGRDGKQTMFTSTKMVGGVTAQNFAVLKNNKVENVIITNIGVERDTSLGAVCGVNEKDAVIFLPANEIAVKNVDIVVETDNCNAGGVTGTNRGLISVETAHNNHQTTIDANMSKIGASIRYSQASIGNMGGVAGQNTGVIEYCQVIGNIKGDQNIEKNGYGGIVGFNGYATADDWKVADAGRDVNDHRAKVQYCTFDGEVYALGSWGSPAMVGGIAGVNGYGSFIQECSLGVLNQDINGHESRSTRIYVGDDTKLIDTPYTSTDASHIDMIAYAYLGGVAGGNHGEIGAMDMQRTTSDEIRVYNHGSGTTGGVVGMQYAGGSISGYKDENDSNEATNKHYLSTPATMKVLQNGGQNDFGIGGVIGYDKSGEAVRFVINRADVTDYYPMNIKVGGVIGSVEQQDNPVFIIEDCENYGKVNGFIMTGGIVGRIKFCGFNMQRCTNYGDIYSMGGKTKNDAATGVGGIVGTIYEGNRTVINIKDCTNHGKITAEAFAKCDNIGVGGIFGSCNGNGDTDKTKLYYRLIILENCINTGNIEVIRNNDIDQSVTITERVGAIIGSYQKSVVYMNNCQNYANSVQIKAMAGSSVDTGKLYTANCLDVVSDERAATIYENSRGTNGKNLFFLRPHWIQGTSDATNHVIFLKQDDNTYPYNIYVENNTESGFRMEINTNRYNFFDNDSYEDSKRKGPGSRINVYEEMHPKFVEMVERIYTTNYKLNPPQKFTVTNRYGYFDLSWKQVEDAYQYEITYVIKHADGTEEAPVTALIGNAGPDEMLYPVWISEELKTTDSINFSIRAVNGYRYSCDSSETDPTRYDSDYVYAGASGTSLPMPKVHMEITPDNRAVAILDNPEDFITETGEYLDCYIESKYESVVYNIQISQGEVLSNFVAMSSSNLTSDYKLTASAKPNASSNGKYVESARYHYSGHVMANKQLADSDRYVSNTYFLGFMGVDPNNMTYDIFHSSTDARDSFLTADILSYNEELEMEIAYSSITNHFSAFMGETKMTTTISDIPKEWFADDYSYRILVREYPDSSQYQFIHYGHEVVSGLELNGTLEENRAILAAIEDPWYLTDGMDKTSYGVEGSGQMVWDSEKQCLKSGYTLTLEGSADGNVTYKITYNAPIEMAEAAALASGKGRPYERNCVDYMEISRNLKSTDVKVAGSNDKYASVYRTDVTTFDYMEGLLQRNLKDGTQDNTLEKVTTFANGNLTDRKIAGVNYSKVIFGMVEQQPVPIIEDMTMGSSATADGTELKNITISFDRYFVDQDCFNNNYKYYYDNNKFIVAGEDIATTWNAFAERSGYYASERTATQKYRIMNAYYFAYMPRVDGSSKYKVELVAMTMEGDEIVIDSKEVKNPTKLEPVEDVNGRKYDMYQYETAFEDVNESWQNYVGFKVRVIHLGSNKGIANNGLKSKRFEGNVITYIGQAGANAILPRYVEEEIRVKRPMDTLPKPSVNVHQDENAEYMTDKLLYDVKFTGITDVSQKNELGGYLITVKGTTDDTLDTHFFYIEMEDKTIDLNLSELQNQGIVRKLTAEEFKQNADQSIVAYLDLSDYNAGDEVAISVKAVPDNNAEYYKEGEDGIATEIIIPVRLVVPSIEKLKLVTEGTFAGMQDYAGAVTTLMKDGTEVTFEHALQKDDYDLGFAVTYKSLENEADPTDFADAKAGNVKLEMAIAIYEKCDTTNDMSKVKAGDSVSKGDQCWNDGAIATIYSKASPLDYGYVNEEPQNVVKLMLDTCEEYRGQYAGKWMKIALKASSDISIDSQWTDQDKADESLNYFWIQIPKLICEDIAIVPDTFRRTDSIYTRTLSFATEQNADGYRVGILSRNETRLYELYLIKDGNAYEAFIAEGNEVTTVTPIVRDEVDENGNEIIYPTCKQNANAIYLGRINATDAVELSDIHTTVLVGEEEFTFTASVVMEKKDLVGDGEVQNCITLRLPDVVKIDDQDQLDQTEQYVYTNGVMVKMFFADEEEPYMTQVNDNYVFDRNMLYKREKQENSDSYNAELVPVRESEESSWYNTYRNLAYTVPLDTLKVQSMDVHSGIVNKKIYDICWKAIDDPKQLSELGGYVIKVKKPVGENVYKEYFFILKTITGEEADFDTTGMDPSTILTIDPSSVSETDGKLTAVLDFTQIEDFTVGDQVSVTVAALAKKVTPVDPEAEPVVLNFKNGEESENLTYTLVIAEPTALTTPAIETVKLHAKDGKMIYDIYVKGVVASELPELGGYKVIITKGGENYEYSGTLGNNTSVDAEAGTAVITLDLSEATNLNVGDEVSITVTALVSSEVTDPKYKDSDESEAFGYTLITSTLTTPLTTPQIEAVNAMMQEDKLAGVIQLSAIPQAEIGAIGEFKVVISRENAESGVISFEYQGKPGENVTIEDGVAVIALDLTEHFAEGDQVSVTVQALAKETSDYSNSLPSVEVTTTLTITDDSGIASQSLDDEEEEPESEPSSEVTEKTSENTEPSGEVTETPNETIENPIEKQEPEPVEEEETTPSPIQENNQENTPDNTAALPEEQQTEEQQTEEQPEEPEEITP